MVKPLTCAASDEGLAVSAVTVGVTMSLLPQAVVVIQKWVLAGRAAVRATSVNLWPVPADRVHRSVPWLFMLLVVGAVEA